MQPNKAKSGPSPWGTSVPTKKDVSPLVRISTQIKKTQDEEQLVFGEVYAPDVPDSHGDFMTRATIKAMAYEFMRRGLQNMIDVQHNRELSGCYVVESFIARDDDPIFIPGSWVVGVKIDDPALWHDVKTGELNGFSLDGEGVRVETRMEIVCPDLIEGETCESAGHVHKFYVRYAHDGEFLGGETDVINGHSHLIHKGTITETADGHSHRFSFVEGVMYARAS